MARSAPSDPLGAFLSAVSRPSDPGEESQVVRQGARVLGKHVLGRGKVIADRYRLRDHIARGGMATIWEAEDDKLGRVVAIKFMNHACAADPAYRQRFEEEARAAARLNSPYVVQTLDHGAQNDVPFIVMERLQGEDLHVRLHRLGRLPLPMLGKLATECGRALRAAHAAGIIHRDLKPQNLFLAKSMDGETVKLLDFGVAKLEGVSLGITASGMALGSPFFMSPEQVRCERDLDLRTDLWSFAAILYRAVTGVKPFEGEMGRVLLAITEESPRKPSEICPDLSPSVDAFFEKAFAKKREDRFQSAMELTAAFESAMKRRAGTSGVRPKSMPPIDDEIPVVLRADRLTPVGRAPIPSDHPTRLVPMPQTGLRLGEIIEPPAPPPSERITLTNAWQAGAPLTVEQEHGFSDPARQSTPSVWDKTARNTLEAVRGDTPPTPIRSPILSPFSAGGPLVDADDGSGPISLPARIEPRRSPYVAVAGVAVILAVAILTFVLAWMLR